MRYSIFIITLSISLLLAGCSDSKNATYFKKHPEEILSNAIECSQLAENAVLNNKTCLAIAQVEKPLCERELKVMGRVSTPTGAIYSCEDQYYLIARPIIEAKMQAALEGKPDPVEAYIKLHPNNE